MRRSFLRPVLLVSLIATLAGCMDANDPDTRNCLVRAMCLDIAANRGGGDPALAATILLMSNQTNYTTQNSLSELQHNLAVIGSHRYYGQPVQVRIVP